MGEPLDPNAVKTEPNTIPPSVSSNDASSYEPEENHLLQDNPFQLAWNYSSYSPPPSQDLSFLRRGDLPGENSTELPQPFGALASSFAFGLHDIQRPTGEVVFEIYAGGDAQTKSLFGQTSIWEGSMAKVLVPESIRPMSQTLFGFAVARHLNDQLRHYRRQVDHPVIYLNTGDETEKGCAVELPLYWKSIPLKPDVITPGNHIIHAGIMTSEKDAFGLLRTLLGVRDYQNEVWGPACGDAPLTKWEYVKEEVSSVYGTNTDEMATGITDFSPRHYQTGTLQKKSWGKKADSEEIYRTFWKTGVHVDLCVVRFYGNNHDPNQDVILLSVLKKEISLPDGTKRRLYVWSTDNTDYIEEKPPIPGTAPGLSYIQAYLLRAYFDHLSTVDPTAELVSLSHFTLDHFYNPMIGSLTSWKNFRSILSHPLIGHKPGIHISGHEHFPEQKEVPEKELGRLRLSYTDYTATSEMDMPQGGMRLLAVMDGSQPGTWHYVREDISIDPRELLLTKRVLEAVDLHANDALNYRAVLEKLPKDFREKLGKVGSSYTSWVFKALTYKVQAGPFYENIEILLDCARVMEIQYKNMLSFLGSVIFLLPKDDPTARSLNHHREHLSSYYDEWKINFENFVDSLEEYKRKNKGKLPNGKMRKEMSAKLKGLLNLFSLKDTEGGQPCVTLVQFLLREIPIHSEADSFMTLMALRAGWEEYDKPLKILLEEPTRIAEAQEGSFSSKRKGRRGMTSHSSNSSHNDVSKKKKSLFHQPHKPNQPVPTEENEPTPKVP